MTKYYGFKQIDDNTYSRKTKEVNIFISIKDRKMLVKARGDLRHHILEDTIILLKKILGGHDNL